jgi:hypothetical protein
MGRYRLHERSIASLSPNIQDVFMTQTIKIATITAGCTSEMVLESEVSVVS